MSTVLVRIPRAGGDADAQPPPSQASRFAEPSTDPDDPDLCTVVRRIRGAKRIVVVCGTSPPQRS
jgi:thiamine pyrophosphate-dependent acetolactate synthase large subunit-like protein